MYVSNNAIAIKKKMVCTEKDQVHVPKSQANFSR